MIASIDTYRLAPETLSRVSMTKLTEGRFLNVSSYNLALITPLRSRMNMIGRGTP